MPNPLPAQFLALHEPGTEAFPHSVVMLGIHCEKGLEIMDAARCKIMLRIQDPPGLR